MSELFCESCGRPCWPHLMETGIGSYDMYGTTHHDFREGYFSNCCDGRLMLEDGALVKDVAHFI